MKTGWIFAILVIGLLGYFKGYKDGYVSGVRKTNNFCIGAIQEIRDAIKK